MQQCIIHQHSREWSPHVQTFLHEGFCTVDFIIALRYAIKKSQVTKKKKKDLWLWENEDQWSPCSPNSCIFIHLFIYFKNTDSKKINANGFQSTSFNVFELERTCKRGCINVWVYPTSGHYGSANENGWNTNSKLTQSKKWTGKEEYFERPVEEELTILSVFKAWVIIHPKSH